MVMDQPTALEYYNFAGLGARRNLYRLTTENTEYTEGEHRFSRGLFPCVLRVPWFQGLSDETSFVVWKSLEELETQRHRGHGEKKDRGGGERRRGGEKENEKEKERERERERERGGSGG